jgi:hypothetical protein
MAYATSNPPALIAQGIGGVNKIFDYRSTDATGDVDASGYVTNGYALGMRANDVVLVHDTDASPVAQTIHTVTTATTTAVDLSNGVAAGSTNSD